MRSPKSEVRSPKLLVRHLLAALCFLLSAFAGNAADLYVSLSDFSLTNLVNRRVIVTGNSLPRGVEGSVVVADTKSYTVTNAFWISNCVAGLYLFEVQAPPTTTTFRVLVPDTNGVVYAHSNLVARANNTYPPDTVAWGTAASDARYLRRGEAAGQATNVYHSAAGTGVTITTNGYLYTLTLDTSVPVAYAATAGSVTGAVAVATYATTAGSVTGAVDVATYATTAGSVTGTVAVASYAATSGVSTNATHTNAVATAGNVSGAVISGNGSGLSNAVAIAAGENVTVTTNSGRLFTLSASSSGSATNIMRSAAGSGIDISTNGLLYTFSFNAGILNSYALLIQNNLADVDDLPTARTNLGLHTVDNFTAGELAFARGGLGYVRTGNPATGLFGWHHGLTTNGWFSLVNGFYVDTENFILEVDSAYPMQYAATSGSVTGTVAVASYAATSGVSTNATHTNAVATAGNVSGAVISGNGSGLSNAVAIAAGENVTVTTNSGRLFTIAASSSGSATNIMRSAAGTGVLISTNGLLYTLSLDTAVPVSYAATAGTVTGAVAVAVAAGDHVTVTTNGGVYTVNSTAGSLSGPWVENEGTIVMPYDVVDGQWRATNVISIGNGGALVLPDWDDENYSSLIFAGNKIQVGSGDGAPGSAVFGAGTQTGDQFFWLASTHKFAGHGGALTNLNAGCIADGLTATRYLYTTNLSGAPITNTITISNGLIMSWTQ